MINKPTVEYEKRLKDEGYKVICGVDEVGRGPWAGPFVAAAVIIPVNESRITNNELWKKVNDSKKLSEKQREEIAEELKKVCIYSIGEVEVEELDKIGMSATTQLGFQRAIDGLSQRPDYVLADGFALKGKIPCTAIIRGDSISLSIAAASIIAKVYRDNLMCEFDSIYPGYGFNEHKGYGTKLHQESLAKLGPSDIHRKSFAPIKKML